MENSVVAKINKIIFSKVGGIENIVPLAVKQLERTKTCIDHPCTTCAAKNMESVFMDYIRSYIYENPDLKNKSHKEIFEEALCKMDMNKLKNINKIVKGGFYGGWIPYWVKVIRNLQRNDESNPSWLIFLKERKFLDFSLDFSKIYNYWISHRLNEAELVDFIIYYDRFVPNNKKSFLISIGKKLLKKNYSSSLEETLSYKTGLV